ncbi:MAG: alkaline phosphatase family protein [Acidobacteria bacterium]|nr:alkaline phosphatase family protein [Acidobacteriota bacterium]
MTPLLAAALLVVSVDGLDQRCLDNAALKIPNLRRVLREGDSARGVTGILSKTAVITWPVTVDAPVAFNLPEYIKPPASHRFRKSGWMIAHALSPLATSSGMPGAGAVFVHLVDLDSQAHDNGPFTPEANAVVERTDELIGEMLSALPKDGRLVLVSDHGFERAGKNVNLLFTAARDKITGIEPKGGFVIAASQPAADWLRNLSPEHSIGGEIPTEEIARFAPPWKGKFLFEPAPGVWFGPGNDVLIAKPHETGNHGHWPTRYQSVYAAWGNGIKHARLPVMQITEIVGRLATLLGVKMEGR